jgi:hypothetical protein
MLFLWIETARSLTVHPPAARISFPGALERAAIRVDTLNDILDGSLIIGNGDINALVYADSQGIVMTLTKNDVWDARLLTENDPPLPTLDLIKELAATDSAFPMRNNNSGYVLPQGMTWEAKDSYHAHPFPGPRQCGLVRVITDEHKRGQNYKGHLDVQKAVVNISNAFKRRVDIRALSDRNSFLVSGKSEIKLEPVHSKDIPAAKTGTTAGVRWLKQTIPGDPDWPGMAFSVAVASGDSVHIIAITTSLESKDIVGDAVALATQTLDEHTEKLIENHDLQWQQFWQKSGITLGDRMLENTWYRSLYFLRCVSKPGVQSAGLFAGLINDTPAWHGDYHTNYNIQQTYWGALAANHPELCEPYDRLMFEYLPRARWLSEQVFSIQGAYYPHVLYAYEPSDPAACKSRNGRQYIHHTWGMTIGVNGFSIQPLWWRYKYDPDPKRLRDLVYPAFRDVALFYAGFIESCEGEPTVRLGPSVSPEHWGWTKDLECNYDCTFDIALARYTLEAAIEAATLLQQDHHLVERFQAALQRLPDYPVSDEPDSPVVVDVRGAPPIRYNIPVPASPVFPGDGVSWWSDDSVKTLFRQTIQNLGWNGNNATVMLAIARARLGMPGSQAWLAREIKVRLRPNGTLSLNRLVPPQRFNDYGHYTEQFGAAMAISELLLQSVDDVLRIFPAITSGCNAGFRDLRAQGGFLVSASWTAGTVDSVEIHSLYGGLLRLQSPWPKIRARCGMDGAFLDVPIEKGIVAIRTKAGEIWQFQP